MLSSTFRKYANWFPASHLRPVIGLSALLLTLQLPFVGQPFHMDDAVYLKIARQVFLNPYFPQDFPLMFEGVRAKDLSSMEHLPFVPYFLAGIARLAGSFSERTLHSAYLVFPLLAVVSMYWLGRRFTAHPGATALLLMTCPTFYVLSHTLMSDLPLLALWSLTTAMFISGVDRSSVFLVWLSAAALAGAVFASYAGLCLIPLLVLYGLLRNQRRAAWLIILAAPAPVLIWLVFQAIHFGRFTPGYMFHYYFVTAQVMSPALIFQKAAYAVAVLGGVTVFPLALAFIPTSRPVIWGAVAVLLAQAVTQTGLLAGYGLIERTLFCAFFTLGALLLASACARRASVKERPDQLFLLGWLGGTLAFSVFFYMTGSARYLLPSLPPFVLLLVRAAESRGGIVHHRIGLVAALGAAWSLAVATADAELAGTYRRFASDVKPYLGQGKLWFTGEWGFRAYLEQLGGEELGRRDARPRQGDWIAAPRLATPYSTLFTELLSMPSLVLLAPSEMSVPIPELPPGCSLAFSAGMPFPRQSDGIDFAISYEQDGRRRVLWTGRLDPADWSRWRRMEIPLDETSGGHGGLRFSVSPGPLRNADADWLALAHARIRSVTGTHETVYLDINRAINSAKVIAAPGAQYHTPGNRPVFIEDVWLKQEPAMVPTAVFRYRPILPLRILDSTTRAGFWSMGWGLLPAGVSPGNDVLEEITLYRVIREVESYGETDPSWYPE